MDSNSDFRSLLYNIICCLLVQDQQVLATPSVGKMLKVIRTHLDTASKVYSSASCSVVGTDLNSPLEGSVMGQKTMELEQRRNSAGSWSCTSSSTATSNLTAVTKSSAPNRRERNSNSLGETVKGPANDDPQLAEPSRAARPKRPADFRRISSVSYNDQQLISDLCNDHHDQCASPTADGHRSGSLSCAPTSATMEAAGRKRDSCSPSPWAYRELSHWPGSTNCSDNSAGSGASQLQYTSQSSLERMFNAPAANSTGNNNERPSAGNARTTTSGSNQSDLMNDSGNGTMYEFQIASDIGVGLRRGQPRRSEILRRAASICSERPFMWPSVSDLRGGPHQPAPADKYALRRVCEFKPQQQPSYMSTDDYLSSSNNKRSSFCDDENSSALQRHDCSRPDCMGHRSLAGPDPDGKSADVTDRRCELEWTLNRLINIELKHAWLTSRDTLRRAIRKIGVPNEIRCKVWLILIDQIIGNKYDVSAL